MIESVVVTPRSDSFEIDVVGEIGAILALVDGKQKLPDAGHPGSLLSLVAGAGFEPAAFRL
jgi:site-specific DNA recombinase